MRVEGSTSVQNNQSVERVLKIIEALAYAEGPVRLQNLAENLGLHPATTLRFLHTLIKHDYVYQDSETLKYGLTMKLSNLSGHISANYSLKNVISPYLRKLAQKTSESVCLALEEDNHVIYIDVENSPDQVLKAYQRIGKVAPLYCTGVGKLFLADFESERLEHFLSGAPFRAYTPSTITTREGLLGEILRIREDGVSYDNEECEVGAICIAAPIRDYTGRVVAAISITGPMFRINEGFIRENRGILLEAAQKISTQLGYIEKAD